MLIFRLTEVGPVYNLIHDDIKYYILLILRLTEVGQHTESNLTVPHAALPRVCGSHSSSFKQNVFPFNWESDYFVKFIRARTNSL